ncbi:methyltransferase [Puia dinghuensis]|uniref:Lambda phage type II DNA modification methyltransferase n=1 Tax=Puia dinghuensis TaxID=1792502 RepID=A0A8J2UB49_9BACT|nr:methyltransferase [Puia dinghuensis]GGA92606.1 lambda phage type II DNA modification methyltransferase [Puia dinghuensis]
METAQEVLKACTVNGKIVKLPDVQLNKPLYGEVKRTLRKIGGEWRGGKIAGFVFEQDPSELLAEVAAGVKRNLQQEFQFFETNPILSDQLVALANIQHTENKLLEPSAGRGALVKAIQRAYSHAIVDCYELQEMNRTILSALPGVNILGEDFMDAKPIGLYDRIVANPPFKNNQDIKHVFRMFCHLKKGGRVVSVVSRFWQENTGRQENEFKKWLGLVPHEKIDLKPGEFKASGTNVATSILVIDKP